MAKTCDGETYVYVRPGIDRDEVRREIAGVKGIEKIYDGAQAVRLGADPRCTFLFTVNGYKGLMEAVLFDNQMENIKKVPKNLPLFFVSGADDPVGDLGEGVKKVYGMYKDAGVSDITYRLYEDDRHEILNETDRDQVMADIAAWLNVHVEL